MKTPYSEELWCSKHSSALKLIKNNNQEQAAKFHQRMEADSGFNPSLIKYFNNSKWQLTANFARM